ncbi:methyltransferase domain-containing protein [Nocardioides sp.]|uniref:methyltransferase domain-containing protein n=1 Tax=Nocardioides sp. TaxID=35761 RepID=UPI002C1FCD0D|nr:methyltransferase domain-containing protein [Nocardioides sp.]HXH78087.1 methyltransferase domain-containing protein [Nocardioides sp.]
MRADNQPSGYQQVDAAPDPQALLESMVVTASWPATIDLRTWECDRLALAPGERLLDVGCGLGEAARTLAAALGPAGEVLGLDTSTAMLDAARTGWDVECPARFAPGDAMALGVPSGSFDAARAERVLQWLPEPRSALTELARVLRDGGRVSLIDTDWGSLRLDIGDEGLTAAVEQTMAVERHRPSRVGRRLVDLARAAGFCDVESTQATQVWSDWDPDTSPAPDGCFSMRDLGEDMVDAGELDPSDLEGFVATAHDAARDGRFSMSLTMYAVVGTR